MLASADIFELARNAQLLHTMTLHTAYSTVSIHATCTACGTPGVDCTNIHWAVAVVLTKNVALCDFCLVTLENYIRLANKARDSSISTRLDIRKSAVYMKRTSAVLTAATSKAISFDPTPWSICALCKDMERASKTMTFYDGAIRVNVCSEHQMCVAQSCRAFGTVYKGQIWYSSRCLWFLRESGYLCDDVVRLVCHFLSLAANLNARKAALSEPWLLIDL